MKFLPKNTENYSTSQYSGHQILENYIFNTKESLEKALPSICKTERSNLSICQNIAIRKFKQTQILTIKPADKNLGIVILDTEDYINQCTSILENKQVYRLAKTYPHQIIQEEIENTITPFKPVLKPTRLFNFLLPSSHNNQIPKFYGLPKIHKTFKKLPPMRPIVAQTSSPLTPSARFIDHVLQPLAQSYNDYIKNSTHLILRLKDMDIPENSVLVTIDVESLYPSIPQTECLKIIYEQMQERRHLILTDPNLIIKLLHININFNYFEFATFIFQQIHGTAMGAAFSPTVANIFMSIILQNFLKTQQNQPLLLVRYIDDIFMLWPNENTLNQFLSALNNYHPNLKFTHTSSKSSVNFLDLTIYKGPSFHDTHRLEFKTFQKPQNLYQYLEYTSAHPRNVYKSIILGECIRYLRSNSRPETYAATVKVFQNRLQDRKYPIKLVKNLTSEVQFHTRQHHLKTAHTQSLPKPLTPPLFKCYPPPQYSQLKTVILQRYNKINHLVPQPRFITFSHPTLKKLLIKATVIPTTEQCLDILVKLQHLPENTSHTTSGALPTIKKQHPLVKPCKNPKCSTCKHLNCSPSFTSTVTKQSYPVRFPATCSSSNLIYLITCTKCKKQYVGLTTKQLNTRINHHRSNILRNKTIYLSIHFNFPDHNINNLSVQVIDKIPTNTTNLQKLQQMERHWIQTLKTLKPQGLNNSPGVLQ